MLKSVSLITIIVFTAVAAFAQEVFTEDDRPKIGLVLSGGGAKGMAHIGVLKVLEELNIRPDYIAGTSMGSIMGGLYAIGYSAHELDSIIRLMDWNTMLSDRIPLSEVVPEEKHDYNRFLFQFDLTPKGPKLPSAVVEGQGISEQMNYLTWHVAGVEDFDDFEIPFRCVASDLISGEPYVFESGNLVTAMRASMAIPSVFSPVRLDTMLLVDGGVLDNIPVVTCREMGADIIITVNVGFREKPNFDDFKSIGDILMGSAMIRSNYEAINSLKETDILIAPDLTGYSSASFFDGEAIIELGEIAARERYDELASLADFLSLYPKKPVSKPELLDKIYIEDIKVGELKYLDKTFVLGKSGLEKGKWYTKDEINSGLHQLMGTRYVQNINYTLAQGKTGYVLTLLPKEAYRSKYNFSVQYDNIYKAGAIFNVAFRNKLIKGSKFAMSLNFSEYPIFNAEFLDYRGQRQKMGNYLKTRWEFNSVPFFADDGDEVGRIKQNYLNVEGGFFYAPNTKSIVRGGVYFRRQLSNSGKGLLDLFTDDVDKLGNNWWGLTLNYNRNSFNDQFFATKGSKLDIRLAHPLGFGTIYKGSDSSYVTFDDLLDIPKESYLKAKVTFEHIIPVNSRFNIAYSLAAGGATERLGSAQSFYLGGLESTSRSGDIPFPGMISKEVSARQFVMGYINLQYQAFNNFYAKLSGGAMDYRNEFENLSFIPVQSLVSEGVVFGVNLIFAYNSIIGPIEFGYGRSSLHNKSRYHFTVGFPF
ncbi:patatin-like phospholipase family protein [Saccharicrinis sp. GN24d3]|uniref:patatin-like phospholipase family protein n=1 Tax=Saccharicrinis sp. GN24d3 TaxID=3458416 RepID=UPI0040361000